MEETIRNLIAELGEALASVDEESAVAPIEKQYLGKKGSISLLVRSIGKASPEDRPKIGGLINQAKQEAAILIADRLQAIQRAKDEALATGETYDVTLPGVPVERGTLHPVTQIQMRLEDIFEAMGFYILDPPEMDTDYYNFEVLNIPKDHPARDMQDTFFLEGDRLLRTHTSAGQVRAMHQFEPPFKAVFPGKVYRYESTDASHEHTFHQLEGLMIDEDLSVANLISSMKILLQGVFEREVTIRLRPGYFPFVEPGFELDIQCLVCDGAGCPVCKRSGWVELLPCGMVHPNVIRFGKLDPDEWTGWAFGLGLSRLVMMRYKIDDIRHLFGGDIRFLRQFDDIP